MGRSVVVSSVALAASALAFVPTLGPAPAAATRAERAQARATNVYVQGDSLTVGAARPLDRRLDPRVNNLSIDAQVGRATSTGISRLRHDHRADHARVWVIALGTNDAPNPAGLKRYVRSSLRMAGPNREVVWLTVRRPGGYQRVNAMLRRFGNREPRLHVVDWARQTHASPGLLVGDRVHATARGYAVRAHLIAAQVTRLAQQS